MRIPEARSVGIFFSALIVALGGIVYELIIGTVSSYLIGDSVLQFSLTIGFMLFGMGIGSLFAPQVIGESPERTFILIEVLIALIGGNAPSILFAIFPISGLFYPVYIVLIILLGMLIGFEVPTLFQIVRQKERELPILSRIFALDYFGALVASLLFPLILLPLFGLVRSAYLIGLMNIGVAILVFIAFRERIKTQRVFLASCLVGSFLCLSIELLYATRIAQALDHRLYQDQIVYSTQSSYQKIVLTKYREDVRLFLNGNLQFSSLDEYRYHEPLVHIPAGIARHRSRVLVLGGGDGFVAREILKYSDVEEVTVVDLDPAVTELARSHPLLTRLNGFALQDSRVRVLNQDALTFLAEDESLYDLIIADLPDPNNEALAKLYSVECFTLALRRLSEDGAFVTQATSPYFSNASFWTIEETLKAAGAITKPYHVHVPSFGEWGFVLATKYAMPQDVSYDALPLDVRFLDRASIEKLFIFEKDILPREKSYEASTFIHPVILRLYQQDAQAVGG